ncbi:MAG TPA: hypothetical protein VNW53_06880 [Phenylobacterium sp.]|jgi:hypothetical protein|uniref:hypothetical protein n=1 Tax=Phenylobacterium sp. TaxID=1871053 RepID=UPI002B951589|nr:hypothetical protein [Phenylobacterium sp.]HXA38706.1 hypothetical protein [Phenylobacterium sp.]
MFNATTLAALSVLALAAAPPAPPTPPAPPASPAMAGMTAWDDVAQEVPASLDWQIRPADAKDGAGQVQFEIGYRSEHHASTIGETIPLSTLAGLSDGQLASAGQPIAFTIRHDAGDFRCKGVSGEGRGVGTCVYAANAAFPAALAGRGIGGGLEPYQQFHMAMSDIGFAYLDELKREGYATPSTLDLARAAIHGAGLKQLLAMNAAGYRFGDVATLVKMRDHGVSARYVTALKDYGYAGLSANDLQRLRDHGVSTTYIGELRQAGYSGLKPEDLVRLRDHGVSGGFVGELHAMGYDGLTPEQLTRLHDHGVNAGFIRVANQAGGRLSPDDLIQLRDRGRRR